MDENEFIKTICVGGMNEKEIIMYSRFNGFIAHSWPFLAYL